MAGQDDVRNDRHGRVGMRFVHHTRDAPPTEGTAPRNRLKVLLSSVPSDSHVWNLVVLQLTLEDLGHEVVNLGPCVPVADLLRSARDERPDCVVISSVNGHGHVDGATIITALRADPELADLTVVIGGKLSVRGDMDLSWHQELLELGFDAVFPVAAGDDGAAVHAFQEFLARHVEHLP